MSEIMGEEIKRWPARRKSALDRDHPGQDDGTAASRQFALTRADIEICVEDGKRGIENALRAKPEDVREQYERQLKGLQEAYGEGMLGICARKAGIPAGKGRELMFSVQQDLKDEGVTVPMTKLCHGSVWRVGRRITSRPKGRPRSTPSWQIQSKR